MTTQHPLTIIIIEKNGDLRTLNIKDYKEDELYKKCGFKKAVDFIEQHEWSVKIENNKYYISMYGKVNGKANMENKYDFPPPIDTKLFFGCCALVCYIKDNNKKVFTNLSLELWTKIYEKLFGGFEDLTTNAKDENEEDELENIPQDMKTKTGYLKDGFIDSDSDTEFIEEYFGSELSDEQYDYSDDEATF